MDDEDGLDFKQAIHPENWPEEQRLHTATFLAQLLPDGMLYLRGPALHEGFSSEAVIALTRFLVEYVKLPPEEPLYEFPNDFRPIRVEEQREEEE